MINKLDGLRHISLDVWSTLIEPNPEFKNARTELFRHFFDLSVSKEDVAAALSETAAMVNRLNAVSGKCMDRSETILLALNHLHYSIQNTDEEKLSEFFLTMDSLFQKFPPFLADEEIPSLMSRLNEKFTFSILSNTLYIQGSSLREFFARNDMSALFSFELYSDEMDASKPSKIAFKKLIDLSLELCGVSPEAIIHLGDNAINDEEGAIKAGLRAGLVTLSHPLVHYFRI